MSTSELLETQTSRTSTLGCCVNLLDGGNFSMLNVFYCCPHKSCQLGVLPLVMSNFGVSRMKLKNSTHVTPLLWCFLLFWSCYSWKDGCGNFEKREEHRHRLKCGEPDRLWIPFSLAETISWTHLVLGKYCLQP